MSQTGACPHGKSRAGVDGPDRSAAFSLIELLAVMAIIAIILVAVVPAASSLLMSSRVTDSAQQVTGLLSQARQLAIAHNHTVEVRFYQYGDPEVPSEVVTKPSTGKYRAMQLFEYGESGAAVPLSKVEQLPDGMIFDSNATLSTLLAPAQKKTFATVLDGQVNLPRGVGTNYNCSAFQLYSSGTTKLALTNWFVTLHKLSDGDNLSTPPHNYATVQIDPVSGALKTYRP